MFDGDATFPAELGFSGMPGDDLGTIKDEPGERSTTPDLEPENTPGERAIMAPRDAATAGDRVKLRAEEALRLELGVLAVVVAIEGALRLPFGVLGMEDPPLSVFALWKEVAGDLGIAPEGFDCSNG